MLRDTWSVFQSNRAAFARAALRGLPLLLLVLVPGTVGLDALLNGLGIDTESDLTAITAADSAVLTAWFYLSAGLSTLAQTWSLAAAARLTLAARGLPTQGSGTRAWLRFGSAQLLVLAAMAGAAVPGLVGMYFISDSPWGLVAAAATVGLVPVWAGWTLWLAAGTLPLVAVASSEGSGGWRAIRRSLQLARGARLRLIGPYLVVSLISGLVGNLLASALLGAELPIWWQNSMLAGAATALALAVSVPFQAIVMTLGYANRRLETEPPIAEVNQ